MVSNWLMAIVLLVFAAMVLLGHVVPASILAFIIGFESGDRLPEDVRKVLTTKVA